MDQRQNLFKPLYLTPENSPNFRDRRSLKTIRGSRGMGLDSKGKKKNNETCIRGSSLCSMPERNIRDERVEM